MGGKVLCVFFAAATAVSVLLFVLAAGPLSRSETLEVLSSAEPEPTQTEPLPPETAPPNPRKSACQEVGSKVKAGHVFVYDTGSREMLWCSTDSTDPLFPASITKLFTAYIALELLEPDTVITAGKELGLLQPGSSTAFIAYGSRLTAEMLVEAMLLPSGNDAAFVLAAAAGRTLLEKEKASAKEAVAAFMEEVNRRGKALGLVNTHFVTPDGYHAENHASCPGDLATIGELALSNETIAKYAALQQDSVIFKSGETITWYNTNRLLNPESAWYCEEALGLKTGYTKEAGYCLLAAFRNGDSHLLVGIFDAENKLSRYSDAADLFLAATQTIP